MSTGPSLSRAATDLLARQRVHVAPPSPEEEEEAIAAIERSLDRARMRQRRARLAASSVMLASAAAVVLVLFSRAATDGQRASSSVTAATAGPRSITVVRDGHALVDASLARGDRIVASAAGSVDVSRGSRLSFDGAAVVEVLEHGSARTYELEVGTVRADVARLAADERFVVRTADAEIEVRGTAFRVAFDPSRRCNGSATRVTVFEGIVTVRSAHSGGEDRVTAGEQWPATCEATPPAPSAEPARLARPTSARTSATSTPFAHPSASTDAHPEDHRAPRGLSSELAAQNALFAEAAAAKRSGNARDAIEAFDRFIARYPESALAESAAAERMRLCASTPRAREAASSYLEKYPSGFAREEAARILARERR